MIYRKNKKSILLSMSGGVDSSVSAYLLQKMGYNVEGVFIKIWKDNKECNMMKDFMDVNFICNKLKIKLHILDLSKEYWDKVFLDFLSEYKLGNTPNPDILCNKNIKFNELIKFSKKIGIKYISTGHYVKSIYIKNKYFLLKAKDKIKDQSYFLYNLNQDQLRMCVFPLSDIKKYNVRKIAKELNFINYDKPGSTGICFINNKSFNKFIKKYINPNPGIILTENSEVIGKHNGLHFYTIGQRKGLNIGGIKKYLSKPWFVIKKDIKNNILYVTQNKNDSNLLSKGLIAKNINWINYIPKSSKIESSIKIRYSKNTILSNIYIINTNKVLIIFNLPSGVVAVGQSVVFYIKNFCIGGGVIVSNIV